MLIDKKLAAATSRTAFTAAVLWAALGLDSLVRAYQDNRRDFAVLLPFTLTAIVLWLIGQIQSAARDRLERVSFWTLMVACCLTVLGGIGNLLHNTLLERLGFPTGPVLWTVGLIVYGVASLRIRVFPRYVAWTLILFEPASILTGVALSPIAPLHDSGSYRGGIEKAVAVLILGLATRQLAASPQVPARV